jgi:hypothetical protein
LQQLKEGSAESAEVGSDVLMGCSISYILQQLPHFLEFSLEPMAGVGEFLQTVEAVAYLILGELFGR